MNTTIHLNIKSVWKEAGNFLEYLGVGLLGSMVQVCVQAKEIIRDTGRSPISSNLYRHHGAAMWSGSRRQFAGGGEQRQHRRHLIHLSPNVRRVVPTLWPVFGSGVRPKVN